MKRYIKKNWWFFLLIAIASYLFFTRFTYSTINQSDKQFAVANSDDVSEIIIANNSESFSISDADGKWLVNRSEPARKEAVNALLFLISNIQASSPLPIAVADSLKRVLKSNGTRVVIKSGRKILKDYRVHSTPTLSLGGIGILKKSDVAFQLFVPNYNDDAVNLFVTKPSVWIDNAFSIGNIKDITAIEVDIPDKPESSFRFDVINNEKRLFAIFSGEFAREFDNEKASAYFNNLETLFLKETPENMSAMELNNITSQQPLLTISLYFKSKKTQKIQFLPIPVDEYTDELGRTVRFDPNNLYVNVSSSSTNIFRAKYIDVFPLLRDISYFQPKFGE